MPELRQWSRRMVKSTVASMMWRAAPVLGAGEPGLSPLILGYHRVVDDFDEAARDAMPSLLTSRRMLSDHLDCLGRGYTFVGLDEIARQHAEGRPFERPVAAVTFDDGYRDGFELAWPVLRRKGIPATFFVVSDYCATGEPPLHDRLYAHLVAAFRRWRDEATQFRQVLRAAGVSGGPLLCDRRVVETPLTATRAVLTRLPQATTRRVLGCLEAEAGPDDARGAAPPMTFEMLRTLRREGATIGSHTKSHAWLVNEPPQRVRDELVASKAGLEQEIGGPVRHFAYPDGQFTAATVKAVDQAGYELACTACGHRDDRHPGLTMPRLMLWERSSVGARLRCSPAILACQARGLISSTKCLAAHA